LKIISVVCLCDTMRKVFAAKTSTVLNMIGSNSNGIVIIVAHIMPH